MGAGDAASQPSPSPPGTLVLMCYKDIMAGDSFGLGGPESLSEEVMSR